jgi:formate dehydrogenase major subunit
LSSSSTASLCRAYEGETILKAAKRHGIDIPHLCYKTACDPTATAAPAWSRSKASAPWHPAAAALQRRHEVQSNSERALKSQKMVLEMLLSDMPDGLQMERWWRRRRPNTAN